MADILLATLNAKFIHASFGLRYLMANLGDLQPRAKLLEFTLQQTPLEIVERLLDEAPRIIGLGVYIWNASQSLETVRLLKNVRPDISVILGGPEVSYETQDQEISRYADHVITGEADLIFADVCTRILSGNPPTERIIQAPLPDLKSLRLPYDQYADEDIAHRVLYVEASRGCPFSCDFCLSALDIPVRSFPLEAFLAALEQLLERGARQFKFVDRTFNLNLRISRRILEFFLDRPLPGLFLHFEMIPDRLPSELQDLIARFPAGTLQLEIGIQTFDESVAERIHRRQVNAQVEENLRFLRERTAAHLHTDLIAGLPGEDLEGLAAGFDRLLVLNPQEIQLGILKRLRGAPIGQHDSEWGMVYRNDPPYEILCNRLIDFKTMARIRRLARFWDLIGNSGRFTQTTPWIWHRSQSAFFSFMEWSDWAHGQLGRTHSIEKMELVRLLFEFLTHVRKHPPESVARALWQDLQSGSGVRPPRFLQPHLPAEAIAPQRVRKGSSSGTRQARHLGASSSEQSNQGG